MVIWQTTSELGEPFRSCWTPFWSAINVLSICWCIDFSFDKMQWMSSLYWEGHVFFFYFFFFFRWATSKLWLFTITFAQNSSILHLAVHQPITFSQPWILTRRFKLVTEELWLPWWCHFKNLVRMRTKHLVFVPKLQQQQISKKQRRDDSIKKFYVQPHPT